MWRGHVGNTTKALVWSEVIPNSSVPLHRWTSHGSHHRWLGGGHSQHGGHIIIIIIIVVGRVVVRVGSRSS